MASVPYRNAVGSLIYGMLGTRPDIAAAVGTVSQYLANPGKHHWNAVQCIFGYLQGTRHLEVHLGSKNKTLPTLVGSSDSDLGSCIDTRRSTSGFIFLLGGPNAWKSKKQHTTALSSAEAEYMALAEAAKEAVWLKQFLSELAHAQKKPLTVWEDNQGCIALAKNPTQHARTKHIDIWHHFIREAIKNNTIELKYCQTEDMTTDMLTKAIPKDQFIRLCTQS